MRLRIRKILRERGKTLYWLSKETGLNYVGLWKICRGGGNPRLLTLVRIAKVLGVKVKDLIEED